MGLCLRYLLTLSPFCSSYGSGCGISAKWTTSTTLAVGTISWKFSKAADLTFPTERNQRWKQRRPGHHHAISRESWDPSLWLCSRLLPAQQTLAPPAISSASILDDAAAQCRRGTAASSHKCRTAMISIYTTVRRLRSGREGIPMATEVEEDQHSCGDSTCGRLRAEIGACAADGVRR